MALICNLFIVRPSYVQCSTNLASSQSWKACSSATWSLQRVPARLLWTQSSRRRSMGVTKGSENVVLAAIVHTASPQLQQQQQQLLLLL